MIYSGPTIATALACEYQAHSFGRAADFGSAAVICGFIVLGIGLLRLGWLIEFIPAPAVSGVRCLPSWRRNPVLTRALRSS